MNTSNSSSLLKITDFSLLNNNVLTKFERKEELGVDKKYKYPKKLQLNEDKTFHEKSFYAWNVAENNRLFHLLSFLAISVIFLICLFPVWPMSAKVFTFYTSVVLLYTLVI